MNNIRFGAMRADRRKFMGTAMAATAGAVSLAIAGCGDDDDDDQASGSSINAAASPSVSGASTDPKRGGVWRAAMAGDPSSIDPYVGVALTTLRSTAFVYSRLFRFKTGPGIDPGLYQTEPDLAESLQISDDGLQYTVKLRQNAKWHAPLNRPINADDVVFSWKRYTGQISGTPANATASVMNDYLESVEKIDDFTVGFKLKKTRGDLFVSENRWLQIMPVETGTAFDPAKQMVGTGPWIFESYQAGNVIKLRRNPEWHFGPEAPYMEAVELNIIPEYATRLSQFLAGNIDEVDIQGNDLERATKTLNGMQLRVGTSSLPASLIAFSGGPSAANAPWRDVRVRRAMSMAIDRDALLDVAYNFKDVEKLNIGAQRRWNNTTPSLESAYWLDPQGKFQLQPGDPKITEENKTSFKYDPAEAKKLLAAAGFERGFKTKLYTTSATYGQAFNLMTEVIQQYFNQIGIETEINDVDYNSVWITQIVVGKQFDGIMHIPTKGTVRSQYENYYLPSAVANYSQVDDQELTTSVRDMLAERDAEKARLRILDLQNYLNDKMYNIPMQLGAGGDYTGYSPPVRRALDYQVNVYDQGNETIPYFWKA